MRLKTWIHLWALVSISCMQMVVCNTVIIMELRYICGTQRWVKGLSWTSPAKHVRNAGQNIVVTILWYSTPVHIGTHPSVHNGGVDYLVGFLYTCTRHDPMYTSVESSYSYLQNQCKQCAKLVYVHHSRSAAYTSGRVTHSVFKTAMSIVIYRQSYCNGWRWLHTCSICHQLQTGHTYSRSYIRSECTGKEQLSIVPHIELMLSGRSYSIYV